MLKTIRITAVVVLYSFAALCGYCWYVSEDYNKFDPKVMEGMR